MQRFIQQRSKNQLAAGPLVKKAPASIAAYTSILFLLIFLTASTVSSLWATLSTTNSKRTSIANKTMVAAISTNHGHNNNNITNKVKCRKRFFKDTLNCTTTGNQTCSTLYPTSSTTFEINEEVCPEYFRWIHEDLHAWKTSGISRDMVERAKKTAHFRLIVKKGKIYVEKYKKSIQTRDVFTIWGIMQLIRRYPGMVPDIELMFDCDDQPVVMKRHYHHHGSNNITGPPPLFRYCGDRWTLDIVFPDWSFWGWAEINIKSWEHLLKDIKEGNKRIKWNDREPFAYWKGNPFVAETRRDLLKCNVSNVQDWNARLFVQDWIQESQQGFNKSNVANQCTYRYKIYIEGYAWSVSEKYILACDSVTLLVKPRFHDFFIRSLKPLQHYWPIRDNDKCHSIKHAVYWGNNHMQQAQEIGRAASNFIQEELKMDYVYDYMFHLLNEYAKLLKFEPRVPEGAVELCPEAMACTRSGLEKKFMTESFVREPSTKAPCSLPPSFEPNSLRIFYGKKLNVIRRIEKWEDNYWKNHNSHCHEPELQLVDFESWKPILERSEKNSGSIGSQGAVCVLPNSLEARHLDTKGNIYAFGVLLLEIISGRPPYCKEKGYLVDWAKEYLEMPEVMSYVVDPELKHFRYDDLKVICEVITLCINPDTTACPSTQELCSMLESRIDTSISVELNSSSLAWAELALLS